MAFLDNSGDIILDAVLTDTGRYRLAKGDGSFRIAKFALGDDEINYGLFVSNTGSAYQDLAILQTPVFEAFTNNDSLMKSTLTTISDENLLYLPTLKVNELIAGTERHSNGMFTIAVNQETEDKLTNSDKVLFGYSGNISRWIQIDQGIDSAEVPPTRALSSELVETTYLITIPNWAGKIIAKDSMSEARLAYIDDDDQANYYLTTGDANGHVVTIGDTNPNSTTQVHAGSRGTSCQFRIMASLDLLANSLFTKLGSTVSMSDVGGTETSTYYYLDTNVGCKGVTTGFNIPIPVRFIKYKTE